MLKLLTRAEDDPPTLSNYLKGVVQKYLEKDEDKERAKALFEHEKERIKELAFWSDVSELSTPMPYHINPIAFLGNVNRDECPSGDPDCFCINDVKLNNNNFINHKKIKHNRLINLNLGSMLKENVKIIVLHRTAGGKAANTMHGWTDKTGAHFIIDNARNTLGNLDGTAENIEKDGDIYQVVDLNQYTGHMGANRFKNTIANGWHNNTSIGIEVAGYSFNKDETVKNPKIHDHWESVTEKQARSVACLVKYLLNYFDLTIADVKVHEKLCSKTSGEGQVVYDAFMEYWD